MSSIEKENCTFVIKTNEYIYLDRPGLLRVDNTASLIGPHRKGNKTKLIRHF